MLGVIIAVLAIVAIIAALALAVPRMRGRARPATRETRRQREHGEPPPDADRHRGDRDTRREERALLREGEAIRDHVESRLQRERPVRPLPQVPTPPVVAYEPVDPVLPVARPGQRRRRSLTARDELALQIERDRLAGYDPGRPAGPPPVDPELLPPGSVSDTLDLQLQEIAAESRLRPPAVVPPGVSRRRRRLGFARPHAAFEEPEDDRLEP